MKKILFYILILVLVGSFFGAPAILNAQTNTYQLLEPLPCDDSTAGCENGKLVSFDPTQSNNLSAYLNMAIKIIIGLAGVLSVVMIVVGGIEYMTSELSHTKEAGKERILHAIVGLLVALGAYALLYTINPDLLKSDLRVPTAIAPAPTNSSVTTAPVTCAPPLVRGPNNTCVAAGATGTGTCSLGAAYPYQGACLSAGGRWTPNQ